MLDKVVSIDSYKSGEESISSLLDDRIEKLIFNVKKSQSPESTMLMDRSIVHLNFLKDILNDLSKDYYDFEILGDPESTGYTSIYINPKNSDQKKLLYSQDYNVKAGAVLEEDLFKTKDLMVEYIKRQIDSFEEERKRQEYINRSKDSNKNLVKNDDVDSGEDRKVA